MTPSRYFRAGTHMAFGGLLLGFALIMVSSGSAEASPTRAAQGAKVAAAVADEPSQTSSIVNPSAGQQTSCDRSRKRLWVEGEGWIVRRVAICR